MSTDSIALGLAPGNAASTSDVARPSFLERWFGRLIEARMRQGKLHVAAVLARKSDAQLADLGLDADEIATVRATGKLPASFWHKPGA